MCFFFFVFFFFVVVVVVVVVVVFFFHFPRSAEEIPGSVLYRQIWQCNENIIDCRGKGPQ